MSPDPRFVLDASALLAYLQDEPGAGRVEEVLNPDHGALISAANWAETLSKLAERGLDPDAEADRLVNEGIVGEALTVCPLDEPTAREIARLRPLTASIGLSLGDRACLALARTLRLPVLTTEGLWQKIDLGVDVEKIR